MIWNWNFRQLSTVTKKWSRGSTEAWLDHFCIWPNRRGQMSCSTFCPDTWMHLPINTECAKKRFLQYLQGSVGLKATYTKEASYDLVGESDADWSGDVNDRKWTTGYYFKLYRTWRSTQLVCQKAGHSCFFFIRSRILGHCSSSSGSIVSETTSEGFRHPTETSNGNCRG